ncbi:MAG: L,D-transpeptidase [Polyangiaceae bacterium]
MARSPTCSPSCSIAATTRLTRDDKGLLTASGAFEAYSALSLVGNSRDDMLETTEGSWVSQKAGPLFQRNSWPGFIHEGDTYKWIEVHIREQILIAYEGKHAVFVTRVSTGAGGEDPDNETSTPKGMWKVQAKHVSATMTGDQVENDYELQDVPYVQYFQGGYALHAAFWHEKFGTPVSHGCVNLSPRDAAWLFEWTLPEVPSQWHGAEANGEGTLLFIH